MIIDSFYGKTDEEIKEYIDNNEDDIDHIAFYFAKEGNLKAIKYLLEEQKLDPNTKNAEGKTLLFPACSSGNLELVRYLVEDKKLKVNVKIDKGQTILLSVCQSGNLELLKYLIEEKDFYVNNRNMFTKIALTFVCRKGNLDFVKYFGERGANLSLKDKNENTLLFPACKSGNLELVKYLVEEKGVDIVLERNNGQALLNSAVNMEI